MTIDVTEVPEKQRRLLQQLEAADLEPGFRAELQQAVLATALIENREAITLIGVATEFWAAANGRQVDIVNRLTGAIQVWQNDARALAWVCAWLSSLVKASQVTWATIDEANQVDRFSRLWAAYWPPDVDYLGASVPSALDDRLKQLEGREVETVDPL